MYTIFYCIKYTFLPSPDILTNFTTRLLSFFLTVRVEIKIIEGPPNWTAYLIKFVQFTSRYGNAPSVQLLAASQGPIDRLPRTFRTCHTRSYKLYTLQHCGFFLSHRWQIEARFNTKFLPWAIQRARVAFALYVLLPGYALLKQVLPWFVSRKCGILIHSRNYL